MEENLKSAATKSGKTNGYNSYPMAADGQERHSRFIPLPRQNN